MSDHNKRYRTRSGNPTPRKQKGPKLSKISQDGSKFLMETLLEKENIATLLQLVHTYYLCFQVFLAPSTIYRHLVRKCKITIKRAHPDPELCTNDETKNMHKKFVENYIQTGVAKYGQNYVYIDKASFSASMRRNYGWSRKGKTAHIKVPKLRTRSKTVIAAISYTGIVDVYIKTTKGGTHTWDFVAFLEHVMNKPDEQGRRNNSEKLIYDSAPIHTATCIGDRITERGYNFVRLPRYCPFLNPIEEFFSKVKLLFFQVDIVQERQSTQRTTETDKENR